MPQFFIQPDSVTNGLATLSGDEAHHAQDVFRLKKGDSIKLFDGQGKGFKGSIVKTSKREIQVRISHQITQKPVRSIEVSVAQSILPRDAMDLVITKATELGADAILPFESLRCTGKVHRAKKLSKQNHWRKQALSACKQCERLTLPIISESLNFRELLDDFKRYSLCLVAHPSKGKSLKQVLSDQTPKKALVVVGPEGGFTNEEMEEFIKQGAQTVDLGDAVLRSETASLYMLSVLKYVG